MAQPSGVALDSATGVLYVADSGSQRHRAIDSSRGGRVRTVGAGLFELATKTARTRSPLAASLVGLHDGQLYVADSYNHKIKRLDRAYGRTFSATVCPACRRPRKHVEFAEPAGLSVAGSSLYIADTNNHAIRVCNLTTGEVATLR